MSSIGSIFVNVQPGALAGKVVLKSALTILRAGEEVHVATCCVCHRQNFRKLAAVLQSMQQELAPLLALNAARVHFHVVPVSRNGCKYSSCEQAAERLCTLAESLQCRAFVLGDALSEKDAMPTAAMRLGSNTHRWIVRNSSVPVVLAKNCRAAASGSTDRRPSFLETGLRRTFSRKSSSRSDTTPSTLASDSCDSFADTDGATSTETSTHSSAPGTAADSSIHRMLSNLTSVSESARQPRRLSTLFSLKRRSSSPATATNSQLPAELQTSPNSSAQLPVQPDGSVSSSKTVMQWLSKASFTLSPRTSAVTIVAPA